VFPVPHPTLGQEIAAAVVLRSAGAADEAGLLAHARGRLASFKVPRKVVVLDALPRTATGKVQRADLAQWLDAGDNATSSSPRRDSERRAPARSPLEIALTGLWASILGRATVEPDEDFFLLGGDSLSAVRLAGQVQEAFGVNLSFADILDQASTVAGMAYPLYRIEARNSKIYLSR
jgi:acyl carrier protein